MGKFPCPYLWYGRTIWGPFTTPTTNSSLKMVLTAQMSKNESSSVPLHSSQNFKWFYINKQKGASHFNISCPGYAGSMMSCFFSPKQLSIFLFTMAR